MRRIAELDALRGLAGLSIVVYHFRQHLGLKSFVLLDRLGWGAVDLFFVLSGFLITGIILRHGEQRGFLGSFYARRSLRIWPIYFLVMFGVLIVNRFLAHPYVLDAMPQYLTYTQKIQAYWGGVMPPCDAPLGHTWTLAIEEQFYLVWPALVLLFRRRVAMLCLGTMLLSSVIRTTAPGKLTAALGLGTIPPVDAFILLGRCDGFAAGGLLAVVVADAARFERNRSLYRTLFLGIAALTGAYLVYGSYRIPGNRIPLMETVTTWHFFAVLGLIVGATGHRVLSPLRWRWLVHLGVISYGLYLYHPLLEELLVLHGSRLGLGEGRALGVAMLAASLAVALLSWRFIEQPILKLKDRFEYRPETPPPTAAEPTPMPSLAEAFAAADSSTPIEATT